MSQRHESLFKWLILWRQSGQRVMLFCHRWPRQKYFQIFLVASLISRRRLRCLCLQVLLSKLWVSFWKTIMVLRTFWAEESTLKLTRFWLTVRPNLSALLFFLASISGSAGAAPPFFAPPPFAAGVGNPNRSARLFFLSSTTSGASMPNFLALLTS